MIENITDWSGRNRFLVCILVFLGAVWGVAALRQTSLDAVPDLSDVQVIIETDWEGRGPSLIEDQLTYPISSRFISAPKVKFVRGESMFGKSFVYVIFEDGTDIYWGALPRPGIPQLGPRLPSRGGEPDARPPTPPAWAGSTSTPSSTRAAGTASPNCGASRTGTSAMPWGA